MITADDFLEPAKERGFDFFTGVPCSFLTPFINRTIGDPATTYIGATSEGEAVAIAAGAALAGRRTVVICQNSGLGNAVNPLTSLNYCFRIPTLLITTWRGQPGVRDEPQHELMGRITLGLVELMRISALPFPTARGDVVPVLDAAIEEMAATGLPFALVMAKGAVEASDLKQTAPPLHARGRIETLVVGGRLPARIEVLQTVLARLPNTAAVIATTGKCGRELFTLEDREQHFYQVGSMGCAGAMGLGVALNVARPVVVLDGDGAALMKLGSLATIGAYHPSNLVHVVLDNGVHDSTGGQATVSPHVDFAAVAIACGYSRAVVCDSLDGCGQAIESAVAAGGPSLIHVRIRPGSIPKLGRPTIRPPEVAARFRDFLASASNLVS
jgi:phosphonopyruvate decarboxylase